MTTTETVLDRPADAVAVTPAGVAGPPAGAAGAGTRTTSLALGLWVVVGGMLAYGVFQTVLKASALFG